MARLNALATEAHAEQQQKHEQALRELRLQMEEAAQQVINRFNTHFAIRGFHYHSRLKEEGQPRRLIELNLVFLN